MLLWFSLLVVFRGYGSSATFTTSNELLVDLEEKSTISIYENDDTSKIKPVTVQPKDDAFVPYRLAVLDDVLKEYDKREWPTYGKPGKSTPVKVNIYINSLGSVDAAHMQYKTDIYLRQSWFDHRLNITRFGVNETLTLNGEDVAHRIWKPDLFFRNVKQANFHYVTVPNMLVKISPEGQVLFSVRLTLTLHCHMSFKNYPLDTQTCYIIVGAYAQTTDQTTVYWQEKEPIMLDESVEVPEFDITSILHGQFTRHIDTGSFSFLNVSFVLHRQNGYHVVQTYLPTFLIVMISWVSFWLNVDASPPRVTLGVTTLLTLTTVASGVRTQLPPVSYVKAIDVWIGACSLMVFGALLEFAFVNFLSQAKAAPPKPKSNDEEHVAKKDLPIQAVAPPSATPPQPIKIHLKKAVLVDRISRVAFPVAFFAFNVIYWPYYLNSSND